jgi:hypothetical protein
MAVHLLRHMGRDTGALDPIAEAKNAVDAMGYDESYRPK